MLLCVCFFPSHSVQIKICSFKAWIFILGVWPQRTLKKKYIARCVDCLVVIDWASLWLVCIQTNNFYWKSEMHKMQQPLFISLLTVVHLLQFSATFIQWTHQRFFPPTSTRLHSYFFLLHEFISKKHFDQLNSKCECHWIWHRWMISVASEQMKKRDKRNNNKNDMWRKKISILFGISLVLLFFRLSWLVHRWKWTYGLLDWRSRDMMITFLTNNKYYMNLNS